MTEVAHIVDVIVNRLQENSDYSARGVGCLDLGECSPLSPALRVICSKPIPESIQHVAFTRLTTIEARVAFHLVRYALGVDDWEATQRVDLQRLQLLSHWLSTVEAFPNWFNALKR